jgi:type I restriction enzyme S subunit
LIRPNTTVIDSEFLWHMLRSGILFRRAWQSITGTAQPTVPLKAIRRLPVPVPPLSDQRRYVAHLDALQARITTLAGLQDETATELDALLPAVLAEAFTGRL